MPPSDPRYRHLIDELVEACSQGQGQIGPDRARTGVWNRNASADSMPDQHTINVLLTRLDEDEREVLAILLESRFQAGVHETLRILHDLELPPFEDGYEGTPYHDFIGRLNGWQWPDE